MKSLDRDDALLMLNRLSRLPSPAPDPVRAARVLERCHRQLARRQRRRLRWRGFSRRFLEPAVIGAYEKGVPFPATTARRRGLTSEEAATVALIRTMRRQADADARAHRGTATRVRLKAAA